MKKLLTLLLATLTLLSCNPSVSREVRDLRAIKSHYRNMLINGGEESRDIVAILLTQSPEAVVSDQVTVDVQQRYPATEEQCRELIQRLNPDGSWPDINYADEAHSGWDLKRHTDRALILAKLYADPKTSRSMKRDLEQALHSVLDYWFRGKFICGNWWYNEIGVAKTLGESFILFEDAMSEEELRLASQVVLSHAEIKEKYTGQNLVWIAGNVLIRALLDEDYALATKCRNTIMNEIVADRPEGIKPDWSFHQHGALQQFGNYGLSYIMSMSLYANILSDTSLAFDPERIELLCNLMDRGYRWTMWRGMFDINSLTRQLYHNAQRDKAMGVALSAAMLRGAAGGRSEEIYQSIYRDNYLSDKQNKLIGSRYFWSSDCAFHRTRDWMVSLRCTSARTRPTEVTNDENGQGYNVGQGVMFTYLRGDEYLNDMQYWDWNYLPGVTSFTREPSLRPNKRANNRSEFVGGVSDGEALLAAEQIEREDLTAHKYWIMNDEFVLAFGDHISSRRTDAEVVTTVEQRAVLAELNNLGGGRFHHDNVGYVALGETQITATQKPQSGSWSDFIPIYEPAEGSKEMMTLKINHGKSPKNGQYSYVVLPNTTREDVAKFDTSRITINHIGDKAIEVNIANDREYIVVLKPFNGKLSTGKELNAPRAGLYILHDRECHFAAPGEATTEL